MILCVGASGCGKTSLLKILKQKCVQENAGNQEGGKDAKKTEEEPQIPDTRYPAAISTVGTDILTLPGRVKKGKPGDASFSEVVIIREVGGVMAPIWQSYIEPGKTNAILYVVDASSPETLGTSTIHLLELLNHTSVANITPILIVFSKTDLRSSRTLAEVKNVMRIDHLLSTGINSQLITLVEFDVVSKQNIDKVVDWCMQFIIPVPVAEPAQ